MKKYILLIFAVITCFSACDDILDRPQKSSPDDSTYWKDENTVRLFVNGFYANYFVGYNSGWGTAYAPLRGYNFCDDLTKTGVQDLFEASVPSSRKTANTETTLETPEMLAEYWGPTWSFVWVRKVNILHERLEEMKEEGKLSDTEYAHWKGVACFFRGFEYSRLVSVFGDVPYFDASFSESDFDTMYKDRDDRGYVMDKVYEDFQYALENIRESDGNQYLNRYMAAGFITRLMLFEGTWQKYHNLDSDRAKKYLQLVESAGDYVISSGKYKFTSDFRSLFGSQDLAGNEEVLMYRHYDDALAVRHCIASYCNRNEGDLGYGANLSLAKSFICADGQPYQLSSLSNADVLDISNMVATRDPRFEATFWHEPMVTSPTLLYCCKFIDREGVNYYGQTPPAIYASNTNTNDYPVMRYAEVVLNWIEAKAELAESYGGSAVTQADLDVSVNAIRNRPLDDEAIQKGVQQTAPLTIGAIPDDPFRDVEVSALLWEIRRERRMEFFGEHTRLLDIKRWKKIQHMSGENCPDILRGIWTNFPQELTEFLVEDKVGVLQVEKEDGTIVTYDGTNASQMVGYYIPVNVQDRDSFTDRVYLSPVGEQQITEYSQKGYKLTQTTLW
ncbi:MAG: RagB/SusD family nutrient uptake outer membrane protein [Bacteroides sp.]|nr:RagB/SusD family nutrient uptake outer membrane protein [Bacteroides sp.]